MSKALSILSWVIKSQQLKHSRKQQTSIYLCVEVTHSRHTATTALVLVQRDMGDLKLASASLQRAANMGSNLLGEHEDAAYSYFWLGLVQRDMGDLKGALNS